MRPYKGNLISGMAAYARFAVIWSDITDCKIGMIYTGTSRIPVTPRLIDEGCKADRIQYSRMLAC